MSIFKFLGPFVSEHFFEKQKISVKAGALRFLYLITRYDNQPYDLRQVEFYFYSKTMSNAIGLKNDLVKLGYEIYGIKNSTDNELSIVGTTCPISIKRKDFIHWAEKMNEIGFINDCIFDGWGMMTIMDK